MQHFRLIAMSMAAATITTFAFAAGSDSTEPPVKTETTQVCKDGQVFDQKTQKCLDVEGAGLSDDQIYTAARELAYDGQHDRALQVLAAAENQNDPRILNYKGFVNRKAGRVAEGMEYYRAALKIDPDYILARSYMGQALIADGDIKGARAELTEIVARGGAETWAYTSLERALAGDATDW